MSELQLYIMFPGGLHGLSELPYKGSYLDSGVYFMDCMKLVLLW